MRRPKQPFGRGLHQEVLQPPLGLQVHLRRRAADEASDLRPVRRPAERTAGRAEHQHVVALAREEAGDPPVNLLEQADHADGRGRIHGAGWALVVEGDVAAGDGGPEGRGTPRGTGRTPPASRDCRS